MDILTILFIIIAVIAVSFLVYSTILAFRSAAPLVSTPHKRYELIFNYIDTVLQRPHSELEFIDLGSGLGYLLFQAEQRGFAKVKGYEISRLYALAARTLALIRRSKVKTIRKDFFKADLSGADVIYMFLTKRAFARLSPKIIKEAKPGSLVIILCDQLQGIEPTKVIEADTKLRVNIYCYRM